MNVTDSTSLPTALDSFQLGKECAPFILPQQSSLESVREAISYGTKEVFRRMLRWEIAEVHLEELLVEDLIGEEEGVQGNSEITCCGIVGLSGSARGSIVVNFTASVAKAATAELFGAPSESVDSNVIDTVGELTNIIGGSSKDKLTREGLLLGLPTVIIGKEQSIGFDQGVQMEFFRFLTPHGKFTVEIALSNLR